MADPFPAGPAPTIRPDASRIDPSATSYADADIWRAVDELQAASRHFSTAVDLLNRALDTRAAGRRTLPAGHPAPEAAASIRPGERA
ncbi:MAG: hypothetical protein KGZ61_12200 [Sandarakinorhabdus sp.]|nr:hypothetical protein [Sandarakinorhabdus sp.]